MSQFYAYGSACVFCGMVFAVKHPVAVDYSLLKKADLEHWTDFSAHQADCVNENFEKFKEKYGPGVFLPESVTGLSPENFKLLVRYAKAHK